MNIKSLNSFSNFNNFSNRLPRHSPYLQPARQFTKTAPKRPQISIQIEPPAPQIKTTIDGPSAWKQFAFGMMCLPVSIPVQAAAIGVGILKGWTDWETVKTFFPSQCPIPDFLPLATQRLVKYSNFQMSTNLVPTEEFLFRVLLQKVILTEAPKWILQKFAPSKVHWVDSNLAKAARVVTSAAAFSAYHLQNAQQPGFLGLMMPGITPSLLNMQLCNTFALGLVLGALQEKTKSAWASVGLHLGYNVLVFGLFFRKCW